MAQQGERSAHPQTLDFRSYQELSALRSHLALAVWGIFIRLRHTPSPEPVIPSSATFRCPPWPCLPFPFTFIGPPGPLTCAVRQAAFGVTFTTCVSTVLAKTVVVVAASHGTRPQAQMRKFWGQFSPKPSPWSVLWSGQPHIHSG